MFGFIKNIVSATKIDVVLDKHYGYLISSDTERAMLRDMAKEFPELTPEELATEFMYKVIFAIAMEAKNGLVEMSVAN